VGVPWVRAVNGVLEYVHVLLLYKLFVEQGVWVSRHLSHLLIKLYLPKLNSFLSRFIASKAGASKPICRLNSFKILEFHFVQLLCLPMRHHYSSY